MAGFAIALIAVMWLPASVRGHGSVSEKIHRLSAQIDKTPRNAHLYVRRGRAYLDEARYYRAIGDLRRALKIEPSLRSAHYFLAQAELAVNRRVKAEASAKRFLASLADDDRGGRIRAHRLLGHVLAARGKLDRAADHYYRAFSLSESPRPRDVIALARVYARAKRVDDALRAIDAGIAKLGPLVTLERQALELEQSHGRYQAALARLDRLIAASKHPAPWLYRKATLLRDRGDLEGARHAAALGLRALADLPAGRRRAPALVELQAKLQALR